MAVAPARRSSRALAALALFAWLAPAAAETLEALSFAPPQVLGRQGSANTFTSGGALSDNGRYLALTSSADNLTDADDNGASDVFYADRVTGTLTLVSRGLDGFAANGVSKTARISADGRYVAFESTASNLVAGDTDMHQDIFVWDATTGQMRRFAMSATSCLPTLSADGSVLAFAAPCNGGSIHLARVATGAVELIAEGQPVGSSPRLSYMQPALSANGAYVAYVSTLVAPPSPVQFQVVVHDVANGSVEVANVTAGGAITAGDVQEPRLSADGRTVAFVSIDALVADDANAKWDAYVRFLDLDLTVRASVGPAGQATNGHSFQATLSAQGGHVAFVSNASTLVDGAGGTRFDVFRKDLSTGAVVHVSTYPGAPETGEDATRPSISADGALVAFSWLGSNMVPGDTNGAYDAFVRDIGAARTTRVGMTHEGPFRSAGAKDSGAPVVSPSGRYVAFATLAANLSIVPSSAGRVVLHDRTSGMQAVESAGPKPFDHPIAFSADESRLLYMSVDRSILAGLPPGTIDFSPPPPCFGAAGALRVRLLDGDTDIDPAVNDAGEPANSGVLPGAMSADGKRVAFVTDASNLAPGSSCKLLVYLRDLETQQTILVSRTPGGAKSTGNSFWAPALSSDGRYVAFASEGGDIVAGDTNGRADVFVFDRQGGAIERVSVSTSGAQGSDESHSPQISADGRFVAFVSRAQNLVDGESNVYRNVYVHDRTTHETTRVSANYSDMFTQAFDMTPDGRYVTYSQFGLFSGSVQVYVRDRVDGRERLVSSDTTGAGGAFPSDLPSVSADGGVVAFHSRSANWRIDAGRQGGAQDVFVKTVDTGLLFRDQFE